MDGEGELGEEGRYEYEMFSGRCRLRSQPHTQLCLQSSKELSAEVGWACKSLGCARLGLETTLRLGVPFDFCQFEASRT